MKRLLIALLTLVIMTVMPFSVFATEEQIQSTPGSFKLIEKSSNSTGPQSKPTAGKVGGYGTINCYPEMVGHGLAYCNWTLNLTKSGEAIHSFDVYITIYDSKNKMVHREPISKKLLGTNYPKYEDQVDFEGLSPGTYTATVDGTVTGRYAVYGIAPVKSAEFTIRF